MITKIQLILLLFFWIYVPRKRIKAAIENQKAKGLAKYGITLKQCPKSAYNWIEMALEECVDLCMYVQKHNEK